MSAARSSGEVVLVLVEECSKFGKDCGDLEYWEIRKLDSKFGV